MAAKRIKPPVFQSDDEAAEWYDQHRGYVTEQFQQAAQEGTLVTRQMTPQERLAWAKEQRAVAEAAKVMTTITLRISQGQVERARRLAERKGLKYQTYIKMLLHEALEREDARA